jgi:hypothetical protein
MDKTTKRRNPKKTHASRTKKMVLHEISPKISNFASISCYVADK